MSISSFPATSFQTLIKHTEKQYELDGMPITEEQFLLGMGKCGYDLAFTIRTLRGLVLGGKWVLSLSDTEYKKVRRTASPSPRTPKGFKD